MQTNRKSIDDIKRVVPAATSVQRVSVQRTVRSHMPAQNALTQKKDSFFNFGAVRMKKIAPFVLTVLITFTLSVATSQGLAKINAPQEDRGQTGLASAAMPDAQMQTQLLAVTTQPENPTLNEKVLPRPGYVHLASEDLDLPDPLKERKEFLEQYLSARGSVLADHVDAISEQSQWKLIVAISRAESSFCKHHMLNNCWGIGGAWNMRSYSSYDEAITDVNRLLEEKYVSQGLDTPDKMVNKWVGHKSPTWEEAVQEELDNLANVQ